MKLAGYPRRIDCIPEPKERRTDGLCPRCVEVKKEPGYSYCKPCNLVMQRARRGQTARPPKSGAILNPLRVKVLRMMCLGLCAKQIAYRLTLKDKHVHKQVAALRKISGAKNHAQLGVWAVRNGHVSMEPADDRPNKSIQEHQMVSA